MEKFFRALMSISNSEGAGETQFRTIFQLATRVGIFVFLIAALAIAIDTFDNFGGKIALSKLAEVGDFVGGLLNPFLAFVVLLVLLATARLQKAELSETRAELRRSAGAMEKQAFEVTFFNLLDLINKNVASVVHRPRFPIEDYAEKRGPEAFKSFFHEMGGLTPAASADLLFPVIYERHRQYLGNYIRLIYWTLTFVSNHQAHSNDDSSIYAKILRAQLSDFELAVLFYNCLSDHGTNFLPLAKKYDLFNSLAPDLVFAPEHMELLRQKYAEI